MILKLLALTLLGIGLTSCTDNPLLGTWKIKPGQNQLHVMCPEITFEKDISTCGSIVEEVTYDVRNEHTVIVSPGLGDKLGTKATYKVLDKNTLIISDGMGGSLLYDRISH